RRSERRERYDDDDEEEERRGRKDRKRDRYEERRSERRERYDDDDEEEERRGRKDRKRDRDEERRSERRERYDDDDDDRRERKDRKSRFDNDAIEKFRKKKDESSKAPAMIEAPEEPAMIEAAEVPSLIEAPSEPEKIPEPAEAKPSEPEEKPKARRTLRGKKSSDKVLTAEQTQYRDMLLDLATTHNAKVLGDNNEVIREVAVKNLVNSLKEDSQGVVAIVFDGVISQRILDISAEKGIGTVIGTRRGNVSKMPAEITILTKEDLY
ncbi:MAG: hypothetical protein IKR86_06480, partial [Candidatus Methanomethylophilaceae archaeon]|nr:hypothetical protein [Candidatus Methanomethylophilaceae archaeon]